MVRRRYTNEFRREAVALVASGQTVEAVAVQLGILNVTLWNWVKSTGATSLPGGCLPGDLFCTDSGME